MIKANELRLGNALQQGILFEIHSQDVVISVDGTLASNKMPIEILQPIPLTPEILEQCGFKKNVDAYDWIIFIGDSGDYISILLNDFTLPLYYSSLIKHSFHFGKNQKFLHQLQNLYFALTGEELALNSANESLVP